jgi:hypothetical protein
VWCIYSDAAMALVAFDESWNNMAKVKLGSKKFRVASEEIDAGGCKVAAADLTLFAARVTTGEISRVQELHLVMFSSGSVSAVYFPRVVYCSATAPTCAVQGGNEIGDDGAKSIAAAVEGNSSLQRLVLVR